MGFDRKMGRLFCAVTIALFLAGCSGEKAKTEQEKRICSLSTAGSAVLVLLGAPPAAVDSYGTLAVPEKTPVAGKGTAISAETLMSLKINTLVLWSYQVPAMEHLKRYGIELYPLEVCRLQDFPETVLKLGKLVKKEKEAAVLAERFKRELASGAVSNKPLKRVYAELYTRNRGAGDLSYTGDLLRAAGGKSILEKSSLCATEHLIQKDPEVIFFVEGMTTAEEIMKRNGYSVLTAVKRKAVFPVPRRLLIEGAYPLEAIAYFKKRMN